MKKIILAATIFVLLIIIMTYPLAGNLTRCIPGFASSDESYAMLWNSWFVKYCSLHNLSVKDTDLIAYPYGVTFFSGNSPVGYIWVTINHLLSLFTNGCITYNVQVLCNLFLAAILAYLLVFYLTRNSLAGLLSGIAFGFCPYMFMRSWQHLGETYVWVMPLVLLGLIVLRRKDSLRIRAALVTGLVLTSLGFLFYYTGVIIAVFFLSLFAWHFKRRSLKEGKTYFKKILILFSISFILLFPQAYPVLKGLIVNRASLPAAQNSFYRPFEDLFAQSARPLTYILPAVVHPVFGKFTEQFIGSQLYGMSLTEHTLYLGWAPLILAFIAFKRWKRKSASHIKDQVSSIEHRGSGIEDPDTRFYVGFFLLLALVAWFFSQPPWWEIGHFKIYLPGFFMYKVLPMFRAYCRFGIVLMLAVSVLAGFGLKFILEKVPNKAGRILIAVLFSGLLLFEFWNWPPYKIIEVTRVPDAYYWLRAQPGDFAIAQYPLDLIGPSGPYKFYQIQHQKKMINGTVPGTPAHKVSGSINKLSLERTASVLKWMGVRYVFVHRADYLSTELVEDKKELENIPKNPGLKFIRTFPAQECPDAKIMCIQNSGPIDVYEVTALPLEPVVYGGIDRRSGK